MQRNLLLMGEITEDKAQNIIEKIIEINTYDDNQIQQRRPIKLYISSNGGVAYDSIALAESIRISKTPVYTYCIGRAMSAAFIIYLAGHKRYASKYSTFLYHQLCIANNNSKGNLDRFKEILQQSINLQNRLDKFIMEVTNITLEDLDKWKMKDDYFISVDEALKLGICHEII